MKYQTKLEIVSRLAIIIVGIIFIFFWVYSNPVYSNYSNVSMLELIWITLGSVGMVGIVTIWFCIDELLDVMKE